VQLLKKLISTVKCVIMPPTKEKTFWVKVGRRSPKLFLTAVARAAA
jgi:hypothetical protein